MEVEEIASTTGRAMEHLAVVRDGHFTKSNTETRVVYHIYELYEPET